MKSIFLFCAVCLLSICSSVDCGAAEVSFGGIFHFAAPFYIIPATQNIQEETGLEELEEEKPSLFLFDFETSFSPIVRVYQDSYDFFIQPSLNFSQESYIPEIHLDEMYLMILPSHWMQLKLGRYEYLPGTAELFSNTARFHGIDFENMISGNLQGSYIDNYLIQLELFFNIFYLTLTSSPFPSEVRLPSADGRWFPQAGLPTSISIFFPSEKELFLENIVIEEADALEFNLRNFSFSVETGATFSFMDLSLLYYHGFNNNPPIEAGMYFPDGIFENYDIHVQPIHVTEDVLGLNASSEISIFRFWTDTAFTFDKVYSTKSINSSNFTTETDSYPTIEYTIGSSAEIFPPNLTILIEFKDTYIFGPSSDLIIPPFYSVFTLLAEQQLFENKLSIVAALLLSRLELSSVMIYSIGFHPSSELEFRLMAPVFLGKEDTDFGQYKGNHLVSLSLTWSF